MMKKLFILITAMLFLPFANAAQFKEGVHYDVISEQATSKPQVAEYFSYFCPHCNKFEPIMTDVTKRLEGSDIKVEKNHVAFIGREMGIEMQKAFATAELLNVEHEMSSAIFSAIHDQKRRFTGRDDIRTVFTDAGIDGKKFDAAVNSFAVNGKVARMDKNTASNNIRGVPALIVNDKYQINMGSIKARGEEFNVKLAALIKYLAAKTN
ncbi:thiol:disulfide interchange protein DsbA/DsbL [Moritella sp. Urea-trap-13]|uniref:thiol:disulfide interchange protein DsbA/DsbL n=1 Tax=Moritella sp. Urea-trap-13 TaxID=2058327 RepID=UPI000C321E2B|nr:thiol:disulfide interchange protein DsbA/DsbL [Moritella sp. Urea-trap-13]PKH05883.1 thiol:disulfide interchange protein [Moritella sp. Urea-trap-13]